MKDSSRSKILAWIKELSERETQIGNQLLTSNPEYMAVRNMRLAYENVLRLEPKGKKKEDGNQLP